ncbi:hypothetical protein B0H11DRAFT_1916872 [Mycena galericulata]|nr:hypothetical protein B0H11DRAFT_1916872 [Mycena galericulata]
MWNTASPSPSPCDGRTGGFPPSAVAISNRDLGILNREMNRSVSGAVLIFCPMCDGNGTVHQSLETPVHLAYLHASSQENCELAKAQGVSLEVLALRDATERRMHRRRQSEVLARESEKRLRDYRERIDQEWNTRWEASFQELADWAKNWTEAMETPCPLTPSPVGQTNGEDMPRRMLAGRRRDVLDTPTEWDVHYWSMIRSLREMELRDLVLEQAMAARMFMGAGTHQSWPPAELVD